MDKETVLNKLKAIIEDETFEDAVDPEETLAHYDFSDNDRRLSDRVEEEFEIKCPMFSDEQSVEELADRIWAALQEHPEP